MRRGESAKRLARTGLELREVIIVVIAHAHVTTTLIPRSVSHVGPFGLPSSALHSCCHQAHRPSSAVSSPHRFAAVPRSECTLRLQRVRSKPNVRQCQPPTTETNAPTTNQDNNEHKRYVSRVNAQFYRFRCLPTRDHGGCNKISNSASTVVPGFRTTTSRHIFTFERGSSGRIG